MLTALVSSFDKFKNLRSILHKAVQDGNCWARPAGQQRVAANVDLKESALGGTYGDEKSVGFFQASSKFQRSCLGGTRPALRNCRKSKHMGRNRNNSSNETLIEGLPSTWAYTVKPSNKKLIEDENKNPQPTKPNSLQL